MNGVVELFTNMHGSLLGSLVITMFFAAIALYVHFTMKDEESPTAEKK